MTVDLSVEIGRRVRRRREELGFTREQLAEQVDLSANFFAEIELGRKNMSAKSLYKVAKVLNLSADYILFGEEGRVNHTELEAMFADLSEKDRELAQSIIETFVKAVKDRR